MTQLVLWRRSEDENGVEALKHWLELSCVLNESLLDNCGFIILFGGRNVGVYDQTISQLITPDGWLRRFTDLVQW